VSVSIADCLVPGIFSSPTVIYPLTAYCLKWSGTVSVGFKDFLSQYPNLDKIVDSVKLSICMLVRLCQLVHWELAESAVSPYQSIMSASAAHVVHYGSTPACAGGKNWFIVEFVLAISSLLLGLPTFLPVLT